MLSPLHSAAFIDSKIVSMVSSACFCVSWRLATRMAIRSLFSMHVLREVRRSKTFDGWERYMTGPPAGKRPGARTSGRFVHTFTHTGRAGFGSGADLGRRRLETAQECLQGLVQRRLSGVFGSLQLEHDCLVDVVDLLCRKADGGARGGAHLGQGDAGGVPRQQ